MQAGRAVSSHELVYVLLFYVSMYRYHMISHGNVHIIGLFCSG